MEKRLDSIDVLRGFDMLFIMGFAGLVVQLCVALGWDQLYFLHHRQIYLKV